MRRNCLDCHKPVPTTEKDARTAAKRPVHYCTCGLRVRQRAKEYPEIFASGYENEEAWKEEYDCT